MTGIKLYNIHDEWSLISTTNVPLAHFTNAKAKE